MYIVTRKHMQHALAFIKRWVKVAKHSPPPVKEKNRMDQMLQVPPPFN